MKKPIIIIAVVLVIAGIIGINIYRNNGKYTLGGGKVYSVAVEKIKKGKITSTISASGVVEEGSKQEIYFDAAVKINKLLVNKYDRVKKGQRLMVADVQALEDQRKSIEDSPVVPAMGATMTKDGKEKQLNNIDEQIDSIKANEKSPIDGVVTQLNAVAGSMVSNMQPAVTIVNDKNLIIRAMIKESDIRFVKVGQHVDISGDAFSENDKISGTVKSIAPVATRQAGTNGMEAFVEAVVTVNKKSGAIRPGLDADCSVVTSQKNDALLVSYDMLQDDKDENKIVYVVEEEKSDKGKGQLIMKSRVVKLGLTQDLNAEVVSGLKEGDRVIKNAEITFKDGAAVEIKK